MAGPSSESRPPDSATVTKSFGQAGPVGARPRPNTLGRYAVLETLGRGGMGEVVRAYDPRLLREVALKVVRTDGMGDADHLRLLREAQAMGKLSHPNVVAVFDVEDSPVGVVVVMELVRGQTLRHWELAAPRPWSQILALYRAAGRGLAAAHAHGLIHRDFKASNVLLARNGDTKIPKVADFGLAKLQGDVDTRPSQPSVPVRETSAFGVPVTRADTIVGTPRYMAPEQHTDQRLTPAADQFAFSAALWQALAGEPPFSGDDLHRAKLAHVPVWPVTAPRVPRRIVAALLRGMRPLPSERWPSVDALLAELHRSRARAPHRVVALAGVASVALAGIGTFHELDPSGARPCTGARLELQPVWNAARRDDLRTAIAAVDLVYAADTAQRVADGLDAYAQRWTASHTEACEATAIAGEQSPAMMDLRMACLARVKLDLDAAATALTAANADVVESATDVVAGLPPLARCSDVDALAQDVPPPIAEQADAVHAAETHLARALAHTNAGSLGRAQAALEAAEQAVDGVDYPAIQVDLALHRGMLLAAQAGYEAAEQAFDSAVRDGAAAGDWVRVGAASRKLVGLLGNRLYRPEEAMRYAEIAEGFATDDREVGELRRATAFALQNLGRHEEAEADAREAVARYQRALGPSAAPSAQAHSALAFVLTQRSRHEEAATHEQMAVDALDDALGAQHPDVGVEHANLAVVLRHLGRLDEAETHVRIALETLRAIDPLHPRTAKAHNTLAIILHDRGNYAAAEAERRALLADQVSRLGDDHPLTATIRANLAATLAETGRFAEAEVELRAAVDTMTRVLGPDHASTVATRFNLAGTINRTDRWDEAEVLLRASVEDFIAAFGPEHPNVAMPRVELAHGLLQQGRTREAAALADQAWQVHRSETTAPKQQAVTAFVFAQALWDSAATERNAHRHRARQLAQLAAQIYASRGSDLDEASEIRQWLVDHREP